MSQTPSIKGANTLSELRDAIIARFKKSIFVTAEVGNVAVGTKDNPIRGYSRTDQVASARPSVGKSVWTLNTNCFSLPFAQVASAIKEMVATHKDVEELRQAFYTFSNENTFQANVWSDNPNLATILKGAPIEGKIRFDEWTDAETGELRSKMVLESVKDLTVRSVATVASIEDLDAMFSMVDDSIETETSKVVTKKTTPATAKA